MPEESSLEDRELVKRLKSRDGHAMVSLYTKYGDLVYSVIYRAVIDRATAEDLTQETFLRIWNRIHTFDSEKGKLQGWLASVLQIVRAPGAKQVIFGPQPTTPHGRLFIDEKLGIVIIAGGLAPPPSGFRYESWIVPKSGAPKPVEPVQANSDGGAVSLIPGPLDLANIKAVAVSMEPDNVQAVAPTKVIFAAPLGS
jgi:hypothetical protein